MKLRLPTLYLQQGWTDNELIFVHFMYNVMTTNSYGMDYVYSMHETDFRTMIGKPKSTSARMHFPIFEDFFEFHMLNPQTVLIKAKRVEGLRAQNGLWLCSEFTLRDERAIRRQYYLIGLQQNNNVVEKCKKSFMYTVKDFKERTERIGKNYHRYLKF